MKYGKVMVMSGELEFEVETNETGEIVDIRFHRGDLAQAIEEEPIYRCRSANPLSQRARKPPSDAERSRLAEEVWDADRSVYGYI